MMASGNVRGTAVARAGWTVAFLLALGITVSVLAACQSEAERLQAESIYHLDQAVQILERSAGNLQGVLAELDKYLADNRDRMLDAKARGFNLLKKMSPGDRDAFQQRGMERTRPLRERMDTLARTYSDPPRVLAKLQEFL